MQCCTGEIVQLAIVNDKHWMSASVDSDTAVSLIAALSEDPANWRELLSYWPRYSTPVVLQDLDVIQFSIEVGDDIRQVIASQLPEDGWLFIDFDEKRIVTSSSLSIDGHNRVFDLFSDDCPDKRWPLSIHLPPWWELVDSGKPATVAKARENQTAAPRTNREFLYGQPLIEHIARQVLAHSPEKVRDCIERNNIRAMHVWTIEIHRNWLMTQRRELNGLMPRQLLHGAHDWLGRVIDAQELRAREGSPLIAAPINVLGFESAPMGREEVIVYFDLCRHLIATAWEWLSRVPKSADMNDIAEQRHLRHQLVKRLENQREEFLASSYEGGSTPKFIIQCSRQRVPRSPELRIVGFLEQEKVHDMIDCDCPICHMMADGALGPSFESLDGYHLELDEEFAFSLYETHREWLEESLFLGDDEDKIEDHLPIDSKQSEDPCDVLASDFHESVWDGIRTEGPLPGDATGQIKLAFMLAEIVSHLQSRKADPQVVRRLNDLFKTFRETVGAASGSAKAILIDQLEWCAIQYPHLVPRIADFQSHLNQPLQKAAR